MNSRNPLALAAVATLSLLLAARVPAEGEQSAYESFENGVPAHWRASRPDSLSVSPLHYKHGKHSLRWDWRPGDSLEARHGLGDIRRVGGYGGSYSKATFGVWLYCETPCPGKAVFQFRKGDKPTGWFEFPLNFTGWRRAHLKYSFRSEFKGRVAPDTDNILILSPDAPGPGPLFIDLVVYNGLMDYRGQHVPRADARTPTAPDPTLFPRPEVVSDRQLAAVGRIGAWFQGQLAGKGAVAEATMKEVEAKVAALEIVRDEHGIRGAPVVKDAGFYNEFGLGLNNPAACADLMLLVAKLHCRTDNAEQRGRLATWYVDMADDLHDQGMAAGAGFGWGGYGGRSLGDATFLMRDVLRERGRLQRAADYFDGNFGFSRIFDDSTINPSMDHFHINTRYQLYGTLMQVEPADQVRCLRALSRRLSKEILHEGPNGFKPDGSAYHHGFHYFAYAGYSTNSLANAIRALSGTPFAITPEAYERVKRVLLATRFYCNKLDLPLCLHGRHPFGNQRVYPSAILNLALSSEHGLDPELAAAYLRFHPEKRNEGIFKEHGAAPEPDPQGAMAMNYAGLVAHRRDHWLALVKGYGKYRAFGEIYANNNRYGRYLSNGCLDILGGGDPVTRPDSGCVAEGWDWNRLDGATVIYLPPGELVAVSKGTEWIGSDEPFVGGLSHRGWNAAFVMQIRGAKRHNPTFTAKKTYFCFDNRIICLGSNIRNNDAEHPTHTNLFQKALTQPDVPIRVNGVEVRDLPFEQDLSAEQSHWLVDTQGTGYCLPAGQRLRLARKRQRNRDQQDRKDTEGDFATAWIDHGCAPTDAAYQYMVLVNVDPDAMREFAEAVQAEEDAPCAVLQKDERAHVVFDRRTRTLGCVFFEAQNVDHAVPAGRGWLARLASPVLRGKETTRPCPIQAVDRACLIMLERCRRQWRLSLCDPDLNLVDHVSQTRPLQVTLRGKWEIRNPSPDFRIARSEPEHTVLEFACRRGRSFDVGLVEQP